MSRRSSELYQQPWRSCRNEDEDFVTTVYYFPSGLSCFGKVKHLVTLQTSKADMRMRIHTTDKEFMGV